MCNISTNWVIYVALQITVKSNESGIHDAVRRAGTNFVDLRDAGDPVEVASMYDKSG